GGGHGGGSLSRSPCSASSRAAPRERVATDARTIFVFGRRGSPVSLAASTMTAATTWSTDAMSVTTISPEAIRDLCDRILAEFHPDKVVLFGSYAYGTPRPDSDVDLLVIMPFAAHPTYKAIEILDRVDPSFGIDLLARTPQQVAERLALGDFFMREIMTKGK